MFIKMVCFPFIYKFLLSLMMVREGEREGEREKEGERISSVDKQRHNELQEGSCFHCPQIQI